MRGLQVVIMKYVPDNIKNTKLAIIVPAAAAAVGREVDIHEVGGITYNGANVKVLESPCCHVLTGSIPKASALFASVIARDRVALFVIVCEYCTSNNIDPNGVRPDVEGTLDSWQRAFVGVASPPILKKPASTMSSLPASTLVVSSLAEITSLATMTAPENVPLVVEHLKRLPLSQARRRPLIKKIAHPAATIKLTKFTKKPLELGWPAKLLDMSDSTVRSEASELLVVCKLGMRISDFVVEKGHHYGVYKAGKLVTYLCITMCAINQSRVQVAVDITTIVSTDRDHSASLLIKLLKRRLSERKQRCYILTQAAKSKKAVTFWGGQLQKPKLASQLVMLFHLFDHRYTIYDDVIDMAESSW